MTPAASVKAGLAVSAIVVVLGAAPPIARSVDSASGEFRCNAASIAVRAGVARWEPAKRELRVMLFGTPPAPDAVRFWTEGGGQGGYPSEWGYVAAFTFTLPAAGGRADQASLRDFHLYVDCPTLHANLTGSSFTPSAADKLRRGFPVFEATLAAGGRVRMTARGADRLTLPTPTAVSWDLTVDAPVYVK